MFPAGRVLRAATRNILRSSVRSRFSLISLESVATRRDPRLLPLHSSSLVTRDFSTQRQSEKQSGPLRKGTDAVVATLQIIQRSASKLKNIAVSTSYGRLMRLDKPVGSHLLFLPAAWSITLAASPGDAVTLLPLFYAGSVIVRGAGCTINDIWDADLDRQVSRTQERPIASGEISTTAAFLFLGAQLFAGLGILTQLNSASFLIGTLSVIPILFYPLAKRRMRYPQAVLGLTFNWGALVGYSAATGTLALPAFLFHGAGFCWTMVYDTIYGHQDKQEDELVGVHSTALSFGDNQKPILAAFCAGKFALLTAAGMYSELSLPYFAGIALSTAHLGKQVYETDLSNPSQCRAAFLSNPRTGAITWAAILLGRVF